MSARFHVLQRIDVIGARALVGAVCLFAYACSVSIPNVRQEYAQVVAGEIVPRGHEYDVVSVDSNAMAPAIPSGDIVVIDFSAYDRTTPQVGDVVAVVFDFGRIYVKRIVAVPGDAFEIADGRVLTDGTTPAGWPASSVPWYRLTVAHDTIEVNGLPLDRSIAYIPLRAAWVDPARLPEDCYFVLGDNVNDSADSHVFGCVPREAIVGKVTRIL